MPVYGALPPFWPLTTLCFLIFRFFYHYLFHLTTTISSLVSITITAVHWFFNDSTRRMRGDKCSIWSRWFEEQIEIKQNNVWWTTYVKSLDRRWLQFFHRVSQQTCLHILNINELVLGCNVIPQSPPGWERKKTKRKTRESLELSELMKHFLWKLKAIFDFALKTKAF